MKLAIVGSRGFEDLDAVRLFVAQLPVNTHIFSGGARGVDRTAEEAANERLMNVTSYRPTEDKKTGLFTIDVWENGALSRKQVGRVFHGFGPAAFYRNGLIVAKAQELVAFYDGVSRGTADAMFRAYQRGIRVRRYMVDTGWSE